MIVEVPLSLWALPKRTDAKNLLALLVDTYRGKPLIEVASAAESQAMQTLDAELLKNTNRMKLFVFTNTRGDQVRLVAVLDNLGTGAGGAAVQNLNLMLGFDELAGL
jgi:N-acetyl-gamma-glutamyl-phosphate reductase